MLTACPGFLSLSNFEIDLQTVATADSSVWSRPSRINGICSALRRQRLCALAFGKAAQEPGALSSGAQRRLTAGSARVSMQLVFPGIDRAPHPKKASRMHLLIAMPLGQRGADQRWPPAPNVRIPRLRFRSTCQVRHTANSCEQASGLVA